ncbi:MAG: hypothetical protein U0103_24230 [Candidatus Obscuribacterales bacterium]
MTIQFKDKQIEEQLEAKAATMPGKSASLVAALDLERYYWLIANEPALDLTWAEFHAFCSTIKAMPHLMRTAQIQRLPILIEDAMRSTTMSATGQYSKEHLWHGMKVDSLCRKLQTATPLQLFALLDRCEHMTEDKLRAALLSQPPQD